MTGSWADAGRGQRAVARAATEAITGRARSPGFNPCAEGITGGFKRSKALIGLRVERIASCWCC